jgi:hypothetical protein
MQLTMTLPIQTIAESNSSEHWRIKAKRHRWQQLLIRSAWNAQKPRITLPCTVTLTRLSPRKLDAHDGLPMSFKWIVDSLADLLLPGQAPGQADNDERITWRYAQEHSAVQKIRIEIC